MYLPPTIRRFSMILALAVLFIPAVTACTTENTVDGGATDEAGGSAETSTAETAGQTDRMSVSDNLEEEDMGGYEFRIIHRPRDWDFLPEVIMESDPSDVISEAIYYRNKSVEERFNIKITSILADEPHAEAAKAVAADLDAYDLVMGHAILLSSTSLSRPFLDWYTIPNVDTTQPWYLQDAMQQLSIGGKMYTLAGEYCMTILRKTYCMFFNKKLIADYALEDPYQLVMDGKWTIDKLSSMIRELYKDVNGDGVRGPEDSYGLATNIHSAIVTYTYSSGMSIMKMNTEKMPEVTILNDKAATLVNKTYDLIIDNPGTFYGTWGEDTPVYKEDRAVFRNYMFEFIVDLRAVESDFGIIPYPKYDETQTKYYSMADGDHSLMAVPVTVSDPARVGKIVEALNAESWKRVIPAYYEVALKQKYSRDEISAQVLDQILDGRVFDFGYLFDSWKGYAFYLQHLMEQKSRDYTSYMEERRDSAQLQYDDVIKAFTES